MPGSSAAPTSASTAPSATPLPAGVLFNDGLLLKTIYDTSISSGRVGVYVGTRDHDLAEMSFSRLTILTAEKALAEWAK